MGSVKVSTYRDRCIVAERADRRINRMIRRRNVLDSILFLDTREIKRAPYMETDLPWIMDNNWNL